MQLNRDSHLFSCDYPALLERLKIAGKFKLGYPESLMTNYLTSDGKKIVDNTSLGIVSGSIADRLIVNVGEPETDSLTFDLEVKDFERKVIAMLAQYFGSSFHEVTGYVTSGGTEGNFTSLWWARRYLMAGNARVRAEMDVEIEEMEQALSELESRGKRREQYKLIYLLRQKEKMRNTLITPVLLFSEQGSHYSIAKIGEQLKLKCVPVQSTAMGFMDLAKFEKTIEKLLNENIYCQFIVSANIGTTLFGAIDDIPKMRQILDRCIQKRQSPTKYTIHGDAALLGMVLPILKPFGEIGNYFREVGFDTLVISGHKFLGTSLACGVVLTNRAFLNKAFSEDVSVEYAGHIRDITFSGCRSGLNVLQIHNALQSLRLGYDLAEIKTLVQGNLVNAEYFYFNLLKLLGSNQVSWLPNQFNVVFRQPSDRLMKRYRLMPHGNKAVACVLMNVTRELIDQFIADFKSELLMTGAEEQSLTNENVSLGFFQSQLPIDLTLQTQ